MWLHTEVSISDQQPDQQHSVRGTNNMLAVLQQGVREIWPLGRAGSRIYQWPLLLSSRDTSSQAFPIFVCVPHALINSAYVNEQGRPGIEAMLNPQRGFIICALYKNRYTHACTYTCTLTTHTHIHHALTLCTCNGKVYGKLAVRKMADLTTVSTTYLIKRKHLA